MEQINALFKNAWPYQDDKMNLPVKDLDAALPFYETVMGFRVVSRQSDPFPAAVLERDAIRIGLAENGGDPEQDGCFFEVDDIGNAHMELRTKDLAKPPSPVKAERHQETDWKVFYLVAPDGLCYCFGQKK